ncbi:hypothetical protein EIN_060200 [Entamoeba invadens IP1]|uniref:hypothetical protein n=1 Tax=Entamoeba invadens IP1 TaxID=370355 RepID=UPI0002C3FA56|nr:hypothetical protein EIN_060200 [Entamoeba invadens IP1]ELP93505.1 hypothetical protein EIN_060200 [Entamoeba invadens IP1]|eukprot:XP_004260276.1 hypothetical protein EIN_060200 [Entamoeba invadens IP1]
MATKRIRLEPVFLMNVVLYIQQTDIVTFMNVSHDCQDAMGRLHVNPWSLKSKKTIAMVEKILKCLPKLETLQVDYQTALELPDEVLQKINRIRIVDEEKVCEFNKEIKTQRIGKYVDTVYSVDNSDFVKDNVVRIFLDNNCGLNDLINNIDKYPILQFVEIETGCLFELEDTIPKLLKVRGIQIHVKFFVRNLDRYDDFETLRTQIGIDRVYYSFNAVFTNGVFLLIPPNVEARSLHGIFYNDGKLAHQLYAIKEAKIDVAEYCDANLSGLTCMTSFSLSCKNHVVLTLPTSLIKLDVPWDVRVANKRELKCLNKRGETPKPHNSKETNEVEPTKCTLV